MDDEERSEWRRGQIMAAASRVFAAQGYHRTTVRQIAQAAGLADGTIYLYFKSKQDLLVALLGQLGRVNERATDFAQLASTDARAFTAAYTRRRFAELREWRQLFAAVFPEVLADASLRAAFLAQSAPAYAAADAELARREDEGELGAVDPRLLARVTSATVLGLLVLDVLGEPVVTARWEELPDVLTTLWFDGLQQERK